MKFRNLIAAPVAALALVTMVGCGSESTKKDGEMVTINALNANKEEIELNVVKNPERIAILDMACLDIIDALGEGDRVVASATTTISYLQEKYSPDYNKSIKNVGTVKVADMEALYEAEVDVIFIGGRLSASYDELSKIATTVYLATSTDLGVVESTSKNANEIAKIFDKQDVVSELVSNYNSRIDAIKEISSGVTCLNTMVSGSSASVLTNSGNLSLIGVECGFTNVAEGNASDSQHGDAASFEVLVKLNPEYIFVMDRNSVTGDSTNVRDVIENAVVKETQAYKNGKIIYLDNSNVWYTASGGITALGVMLLDLETGLGINK